MKTTINEHVVDDVSLAGVLQKKGIRVRYSPGAILDSPVTDVSKPHLEGWFLRQLLAPKFYTPAVWWLLGGVIIWVAVTVGASLGIVFRGIIAGGAGWTGVGFWFALALVHIATPCILQEVLRRRLAPLCKPLAWGKGLALAHLTAARVFWQTLFARHLVWSGLCYHLDKAGKVVRIEKIDE